MKRLLIALIALAIPAVAEETQNRTTSPFQIYPFAQYKNQTALSTLRPDDGEIARINISTSLVENCAQPGHGPIASYLIETYPNGQPARMQTLEELVQPTLRFGSDPTQGNALPADQISNRT